LKNPINRAAAEKIISEIKPATIKIIGFHFSNIDDGLEVPVEIDSVQLPMGQLIDKVKSAVAKKFAAFAEEDDLVKQITATLDSGQEQYSGFILRAVPSRLLNVWGSHPEILGISVDYLSDTN